MGVVDLIVALLMLVGLAGSLIPFLPGAPLILLGAAIHAVATDFTPVGWGRLAILAALAVLSYALSWVAAAVGTRGYGGSRWAVAGALLGAIAGLWFGPLGLLLGPVAGAIAGEWLLTGDPGGSVRSGVGAAMGVIAGAIAHFAIALAMVGLFAWWVWRG
jgi:uncharacterized protein YqgC (DUF456 family)